MKTHEKEKHSLAAVRRQNERVPQGEVNEIRMYKTRMICWFTSKECRIYELKKGE